MNYKHAPFYNETYELVEKVMFSGEKNLAEYLENSIRIVSEYLGIDTEILVSSKIKKDNSLKGQNKIINICSILGANEYVNSIGGQSIYSYSEFERHNIILTFLKTKEILYQQGKTEYIPNLSIIDVMMYNSVDSINSFLYDFEFINASCNF